MLAVAVGRADTATEKNGTEATTTAISGQQNEQK